MFQHWALVNNWNVNTMKCFGLEFSFCNHCNFHFLVHLLNNHTTSASSISCVCPLMSPQTTTLAKFLFTYEQENGFSPVWVLSCILKLLLVKNAFSHLGQANVFLLCGFFHVSWNDHFGWMPFHIWIRQTPYLLCESFHGTLSQNCLWITCDKWSTQLASLLYGSSHVSSAYYCWYIPQHIFGRQIPSLLCGSSHEPLNC